MDKIYPFPSSDSSSTTTTTATSSPSSVGGSAATTKSDGSDYLRHLNKLSHKIAKPPLKKPPLDPPPLNDDPPPPPPPPPHHNPHQHQPPVYNINKNDFRDVVQKLTGSPAHDRAPAPSPPPPPPSVPSSKLPSSRLHRIRPPPLSHLSPRPPPQLNCPPSAPLLDPAAIASLNPNPNPAFFPNNFNFTFGRPSAALSPLPPLPSAHGAAESPVSAYMRRINTSSIPTMDSKADPFLGFRPSLSPRWSNLALPPFPGQAPPRPPGRDSVFPAAAAAAAACATSDALWLLKLLPKVPLRTDLPRVPVLPDFPRIPAFALGRAGSQPTERRGLRPMGA